jgi:hypothetical protein
MISGNDALYDWLIVVTALLIVPFVKAAIFSYLRKW